jgi:phosphoribosylformylglycinamidine synthase subunit PurS
VSKPLHVRVYVTPKQGILDPQGVTIERSLPALGFEGVSSVRVGKFIELELDLPAGTPADKARDEVDEMCRKLLANPIIEDFTFAIDDQQ